MQRPDPPAFSSVLVGAGAVLVGTTVVASLADRAPYATSLVQAGPTLLVGVGLMAAGVRTRVADGDHRSWRSVAWVAAVAVVTSVERVWLELVAMVVGESPPVFAGLTSVAVGVGIGSVVAWYDTQRRRGAERRIASRRNYREVFDKVEDAILVHHPVTGEILDANSSAERLYGYAPEELTEKAVSDFSATEEGYTQELAVELIRRAVEEDGLTFEWRTVRPDGHRPWLEVTLRPAEIDGESRVLAVVRDVTDRKERERELRVKDRALEAADVGVTIADADGDQPLTYVNDAFLEATGYDRDDVLGRNCRFLQGEETDDEPVERLRRGIDNAEPTTVELLNYRADGTTFWNEVSVAPVYDGDEVTHFVGFQRDVTDRKRRERLLSVMNRVLRHNLRNDMMVVSGHAKLLADQLDGTDADMALTVASTADHLADLGEKARELESVVLQETHLESVDVAALVRGVAGELRTAFPDAEVAVTAPDSAHATATADLRRALYELGENALEHGGSTVAFEVAVGDAVTVEVVDDGPGLPEMERDVLGAGRETPLSHGQGIGLCLVNAVVTSARGTLDVAVEDGTAVTVELRRDGTPTDPRDSVAAE